MEVIMVILVLVISTSAGLHIVVQETREGVRFDTPSTIKERKERERV